MALKLSLDGTLANVVSVGTSLYGSDSGALPSNETKISGSGSFGVSVASGSNSIVIGSYLDGDLGTNAGAAYIYDLNGNQIAKIKASDGAAGDNFGRAVAVGSGRICVGSYKDSDNGSWSGSAYIFDLSGTQIAKIKASDAAASDYFGYNVAIGSGRIVVGANGDDDNGSSSGSAYVFDLNGTQLAKIKASDGATNDFFGRKVAIGSGRICVGAYGDDDNGSYSGSAYIYDLNGNQIAKIKASDAAASDYFGRSVAVGSGRIVVGAWGDDDKGINSGSAYIFDLNGTQLAKITASDGAAGDHFGQSVAVGSGRIVVGADADADNGTNSGSAYVFDLNGTQLAKIKASDGATNDFFGTSVSVGSGRIVSGAYYHNSAYIWTTPDVITPYDAKDWRNA